MPCSLLIVVLLSLYRYILSISLLSCFLFYRENCSFFYAYQPNFFFLRENPSLFLIKFLNKTIFSNVAALLFLCPVFFFFFVKISLRSLLISPHIRASAFHPALFFVCVKFSLNKQRKNAVFLIFLRFIVIFCVLQFSFFLWKSLSFQPKGFFSPVLTLTSSQPNVYSVWA